MSQLLNKPELYNRLSCRSPLRKSNHINTPILNTSTLKNDNKPIIQIVNNGMNQNVKSKPSTANNRISTRSVKKTNRPHIQIEESHETFYKVVTQTPTGQTVKVPTSCSFIKFKQPQTKPKVIIYYIEVDNKKKYTFEDALDIFENNQSYITENLNDSVLTANTLKIDINYNDTINKLKSLVQWFNKQKEPKPIDKLELKEWKERQEFKKVHGYTSYLDKELIQYLK